MKYVKKAELSIEFIVLAAIALIFLIVVGIVMTGKIGSFSSSLSDCKNKGGECVKEGACYATESGFTCDKGNVCCLNTCTAKGGECKPETEGQSSGCADGEERIYTGVCQESALVCCK